MKRHATHAPRFNARSHVLLAFAFFVLGLAGCEDSAVQSAATKELAPTEVNPDRPTARVEASERLEGIRNRADDAFAAMDQGFAASETRAGLQPWPVDLPGEWPRLAQATVVADTKQAAGNRLLLVNLPGPPDRALQAYRAALRANGYSVDQPTTSPRRANALHAAKAGHQAVLTFFGRDTVTRVEILFLSVAAG